MAREHEAACVRLDVDLVRAPRLQAALPPGDLRTVPGPKPSSRAWPHEEPHAIERVRMSRSFAPSSAPPAGGYEGAGFYYATLTFRRQRQLKEGARPRVDSGDHTLVRIALLEVMAGLVA